MIVKNRTVRDRYWQSRLILSTSQFVVPPDVGCLWFDGCGGGGGGGGGDPTPGGGGGGGGPASGCVMARFPVAPGEILTLTIGAAGTGGSAGNNGVPGGDTFITGKEQSIKLNGGSGGNKGTPSAGGASVASNYSAGGQSQASSNGPISGSYSPHNYVSAIGEMYQVAYSGAGGALNVSGNFSLDLPMLPEIYPYGGAGGSSGGGGGAGGSCTFGMGGWGGSNGAAGQSPIARYSWYRGAGGGGGSGNASGGNGAPGFIRIYCFTAYGI